jgi:hypothetical protein
MNKLNGRNTGILGSDEAEQDLPQQEDAATLAPSHASGQTGSLSQPTKFSSYPEHLANN